MSEAELHLMKGRMDQAVLNKARRGELFLHAPVGYVKLPNGELGIDPDEQVQNVIPLVFDAFDRRSTVRGVVRYLVDHAIERPIRPISGPNRGQIEWRPPTRETVNTILTHTIDAGTYRDGDRQRDSRKKQPGKPNSGRVVMSPDEFHHSSQADRTAGTVLISPSRWRRRSQPPQARLHGVVWCLGYVLTRVPHSENSSLIDQPPHCLLNPVRLSDSPIVISHFLRSTEPFRKEIVKEKRFPLGWVRNGCDLRRRNVCCSVIVV